MTQNEIIRMAREAGGFLGELPKGDAWMFFEDEYLERFAALVAEPWIETNKALAKEIIELKKQAEQEPVAWMQDRNDLYVADQRDKYYTVPLYAAPVRTKDPCHPWQDLTDDEIRDVVSHPMTMMKLNDARAVIAAYKEKNK